MTVGPSISHSNRTCHPLPSALPGPLVLYLHVPGDVEVPPCQHPKGRWGDEFAVMQNVYRNQCVPSPPPPLSPPSSSLPFSLPLSHPLLPPHLPPSFNLSSSSSSFLVFDYLAAKFLDRSRKELEQRRQHPTTTAIGKTQPENY